MADLEAGLVVTDNVQRQRYEIRHNAELAGFVTYQREPGRIIFLHTEVFPAYGGRGIGSKLATAALDDARTAGLAVDPQCSFITHFIDKHSEYADLVQGEA